MTVATSPSRNSPTRSAASSLATVKRSLPESTSVAAMLVEPSSRITRCFGSVRCVSPAQASATAGRANARARAPTASSCSSRSNEIGGRRSLASSVGAGATSRQKRNVGTGRSTGVV